MRDQNSNPFFIVGSGRSGTTLLRLILSSHSKISIPPETWFIIPLVEAGIPLESFLTDNEINLSLKIITSHYRWPDMGIEESDFFDRVKKIKKNKKMKLTDIIDIIYDNNLKVEEKSVWGDKTPPYINILPELLVLYPEAKFIHLIRDGHDVACSFHRLKWKGNWFSRSVIEWNQSIDQYISYKGTKVADRILEVKYEGLVEDTENIVKEICSFINQPFELNMLNWVENAHEKIPDRELSIHKEVSRRPKKSDIYRWKKECSNLDVFIIEAYLKNNLKAMGYEIKFKNPLWQPVYFLLRLYFNLLNLIFSGGGRIIQLMKRFLKQIIY